MEYYGRQPCPGLAVVDLATFTLGGVRQVEWCNISVSPRDPTGNVQEWNHIPSDLAFCDGLHDTSQKLCLDNGSRK